jgi:putative DNA primase/helicase
LPAVLEAVTLGTTIYIVEGEKDAETLQRHGLVATTNAMGAGKWRQSYTETLRGAHVAIFPDNDPQGRDHVAHVMDHLRPVVRSMKAVVLPGLPDKGDVTDWMQQGHTLDDLRCEIAQTPAEGLPPPPPDASGYARPSTPAPLTASLVSGPALLALTLDPKALYLDWLAARSLSLVYGPPGVGKTMFLMGLAYSLATTELFLTWQTYQGAGVLYVDGEMALKDLQDRLRQFAGDRPPERLTFLPSELVTERSGRDLTLTDAADRETIDAMLDAHGLQVLVLDNISCLFTGLDESSKRDWEPINAWLVRLRHRGITVLVGHHAGKNGQQRGTSGREGNLDTIIALTRPPGYKPEDGCHFYLRFDKSRSIKGPAVQALDVRLEATGWTSKPLESIRTAKVKELLLDGVPPKVIAEELAIDASYVYRLKRQMGL